MCQPVYACVFVCVCTHAHPYLLMNEMPALLNYVPQVLLLQKMLMLLCLLEKDLSSVFACDSEAIKSFYSVSWKHQMN